MGISQDMREMAASCATEIVEAEKGLEIALASLRSAEFVERNLESSANESYRAALAALRSGDDEQAKEHLVQRQEANSQLTRARINTLEAESRVTSLRSSIRALEEQAAKVEALMSRAASVRLTEDAIEDPLIQKFRDLQ